MTNNLASALSAAVPLYIMQLKAKGGPSDADCFEATAFGEVLAEKGDVLFFGSKKKGEAADLFNRCARSISVLSFVNGGITLFGQHWESKV